VRHQAPSHCYFVFESRLKKRFIVPGSPSSVCPRYLEQGPAQQKNLSGTDLFLLSFFYSQLLSLLPFLGGREKKFVCLVSSTLLFSTLNSNIWKPRLLWVVDPVCGL
jgi:hypothetical protein